MNNQSKLSRRSFIKLALATTTTGFALGFNLSGCSRDSTSDSSGDVFRPNAWLSISSETGITVQIAEAEMGQGVMTSLSMLIAEELEVSLDAIHIALAPADPAFGNQTTGGSTSIRDNWRPLREAGAAARIMLIQAAAQQWGVSASGCQATAGRIIHDASGRSLDYTELARAASQQPVPTNIQLKSVSEHKLIGKPTRIVNSADKTSGSAIYGIDMKVPGMLYATVKHSPVFGGKLINYDDTKTRQVTGVRNVLAIDTGIAVVADNTWAAFKGAEALSIKWDEGPHREISSTGILEEYVRLAESMSGETIHEVTGPAPASATSLEASYALPFQAHAPMEPMNCTAYVRDGECDVWVPTQSASGAQNTALEHAFSRAGVYLNKTYRKLSGKLDAVRVHPTLLGGGFGRRLQQDYVAEAVQISRMLNKPIKLTWTREEDIQHDWYRHLTYHRLRAELDKDGMPISWHHQIVGSTRYASVGGAKDKPYTIPNIRIDYVQADHPVPTGPWRSVGHSINGFVTESFMDELAAAAGQDPYEYRLKLLGNAPRDKAVLQLVAEKAGWHTPRAGVFRGISLHSSFGSHIAQVAEISVNTGKPTLQRIVCVVDCGQTINPDTVKAQIEGGIIFALTATLKSKISVENGRVVQNNFHDFELLRYDECPIIEVHIVESNDAPGGIGEVGVPPLAAAVTNALYAATGNRVRDLPVSL